jgi:hypothetical protein
MGFDFPWKNFLRLAEETAKAGWAYVLLSHDMTDERAAEVKRLNPSSLVVREYLDTPTCVNYLAGCDATAFLYECANTGTSGAIRMGLAARKPVLAFSGCRQFRDLWQVEQECVPHTGIRWVNDWSEFAYVLVSVRPGAWDSHVTNLATNDSWQRRGRDHAELYRILASHPKVS